MRQVDGDQPITGKVYHRFYSLSQHVEELPGLIEAKRTEVVEILEKRWNDSHRDMHAARYALTLNS